ncbi:MAG: PHP domain-containing protein [Thermomicrobiales bacterium]|nr:PHP domain-containing protein [Thermomicrobiales bacterium]
MLIDMHLHTRRSRDSTLSFTDAVTEAKAAGVDAICVTDHGRFTAEQEVNEMMERYDFVIFGGAEFTTRLGHFLVYDVPSTVGWSLERDLLLGRLHGLEQEIQRGRSFPVQRLESRLARLLDLEVSDLIRLVHLAGGVVFWAHPMDDWSLLRQWFNVFSESHGTMEMREFARWLGENDETSWWPDMIKDLDGFEILNGSGKRRGVCNALARQVAETFAKPGIAGSDAHHRDAVARVATRFDREPARDLRIGELLQTTCPQVEVLKPYPVTER